MSATVKITVNKLPLFLATIAKMTKREVLVGVPSSRTERQPEPNQKALPITNAEIGYINEYGSPVKNIPARPHLVPGVKAARPAITEAFKRAAELALTFQPEGVDRELARAGFAAVASVRTIIEDVIPPPLSPKTLAARAHRRQKGRLKNTTAMIRYSDGNSRLLSSYSGGRQAEAIDLVSDTGTTIRSVGTTPLIDTGEYRKSITYVIRGAGPEIEGP